MRFAAYAGASTALATAVVLHAFNQRPNFYSATVYLVESQACRMILLNLALMTAYSVVRALQKLLYGPLRAIEREQLWDKSWYAITETALAMTTFRDEVGAYFMVMFVSLLAGKVWAWISESRVDTLEQQPPANPRLFHTRLIASLLISELFDVLMLRYCINTLLDQPRPGMMVMFAFEFAVLFITSTSIMARYLLSLREIWIVKSQTMARMEERREDIRAAREAAERAATEGNSDIPTDLPREEDLDENEIDVPGWQEKGIWILCLDLLTDFLKLVIYMLFFTMLLLFHGIPIHIMRDVYLTTRSFLKRIADFHKYRHATKDMNQRYPDATAQELERDGTCIICREEMQAWQPPAAAAEGGPRRFPPDERQRPKKLPCGHILHLGCLRSWLERQQVCPTCRTSVLSRDPTTNGGPNNPQPRRAGGPAAPAVLPQVGNNAPAALQPPGNQQQPREQNVRARTFRLGPWRFTFAAGEAGQIRDTLDRLRRQAPGEANNQPNAGVANADIINPIAAAAIPNQRSSASLQEQINSLEQQVTSELQALNLSHNQLQVVRQLLNELHRLRGQTQQPPGAQNIPLPPINLPGMTLPWPGVAFGQIGLPIGFGMPPMQHGPIMTHQIQQEVFTNRGQRNVMGPNHPGLPPGIVLPEGWTLLPLERMAPGAVGIPGRQSDGSVRQMRPTPPVNSMVHPDDPPQIQLPVANGIGSTNASQAAGRHLDAVVPQSFETPTRTSDNIAMGPQSTLSTSVQTPAPHVQDTPITTQEAPVPDLLGNFYVSPIVADVPLRNGETNGNTPQASSSVPESSVQSPSSTQGEASDGRGKGRSATVEDVHDGT